MEKNEQGDENCHTSLSHTRWVLVLKVAVNSEWISYTWLVKYNCSSNSQSGFLKHDTITTVTNLIDNCNKTLSHVKSQVCDCLNIPAILIKNFTFKIQVIVPQKLAEIDIFIEKLQIHCYYRSLEMTHNPERWELAWLFIITFKICDGLKISEAMIWHLCLIC